MPASRRLARPEPVVGVGIDLVDITELAQSIGKRASSLARVFTKRELAACKGPRRFEKLAARFAAKEAAMKAAGTGWSCGVDWHDAEVVSTSGKEPRLTVRGALLRYASARGGSKFLLSLSHSGEYAIAMVLLVA